MSLEALEQRADIWRGRQLSPDGKGGGKGVCSRTADGLATGIAALAAQLPAGWPRGALTEILAPMEVPGVMSLLMPALAQLGRQRRWLAWVAPPHAPYAPALLQAGIDLSRVLLVHPRAAVEGLWAVEQALRAGSCGAVLAWLSGGEPAALRRLQLAAEAGDCWGVVFRPPALAQQASPAALRLRVALAPGGVSVEVLKQRGGWPREPVHVPLPLAVTALPDPPQEISDHVMAVPAPAAPAAGMLHARDAG